MTFEEAIRTTDTPSMGWLTDFDKAAEQPRRALVFVFLCGLVGGSAIGYLRFDHSGSS